ncbi:MAG: calcineurin-like phosphoesterase family protein [Bacteroidales bacterium]|nr:calcineurin-like phosphoesterase family protein [Bacteroidales bacterium]
MKRIILLISALLCTGLLSTAKTTIKGKVTLDGKPAAGVLVSDGTQIVKTDRKGRYAMDSDKKDSVVFITTPSGTVAVAEDGLRPTFWSLLTKAPRKCERHDFKLVSENQDEYTVLFLPDVHLSNDPRRDDIRRFKEMVFPFIQKQAESGKGPVYAFNLGDLTHEVYWYEMNFKEDDAYRMLRDLGLKAKVYSVTGNHDHDGAIVGENVDFRSAWLYRKTWGPDRYSVNIGKDHWIFLDNIIYINVEGQGKKAPGINGDRSYRDEFTSAQMAWLEKDLSYVPDDANVYICTHCPFFASGKTDKELVPAEQLAKIDALCSRFQHTALNFAGHIHKFDFMDMSAYPHLFQYGLPCASGIMWETPIEADLYCSDGCDAGIMVASCTKGEMDMHYQTYAHGEKYLRVYDMNGVAKAYRESEGVKMQRELAPTRMDYSAPEFENCIFVNYWGWKPGETVEMIENGKMLKVKNVRHEDPVKNFAYDLPHILSPVKHHSVRPKDACNHMFEAKAATATSEVKIIVRDKEGRVLHLEILQRPKAFGLGME